MLQASTRMLTTPCHGSQWLVRLLADPLATLIFRKVVVEELSRVKDGGRVAVHVIKEADVCYCEAGCQQDEAGEMAGLVIRILLVLGPRKGFDCAIADLAAKQVGHNYDITALFGLVAIASRTAPMSFLKVAELFELVDGRSAATDLYCLASTSQRLCPICWRCALIATRRTIVCLGSKLR